MESELEGEGTSFLLRRPALFLFARRRETRDPWVELGAKSDAELAPDDEAGFLTFEMVSAALASGSELPSGSLISLASRAGTYAVERVCKALAAARRFGGRRQGVEW
jgi:hypothetical protein